MSENGLPPLPFARGSCPLFSGGNPGSWMPGFLSSKVPSLMDRNQNRSLQPAIRNAGPRQLVDHSDAFPTAPRAILVRMDIKARNIATPTADAPATPPASAPAPVRAVLPRRPRAACTGNVFSCLCAWLSARSEAAASCCASRTWTIGKRPELAAQLIDDWLGWGLSGTKAPTTSTIVWTCTRAPCTSYKTPASPYPCFLHARRAPHRERAARQRRHAHLPWRLPRPFGRRGRPPQCPARPGHASARAHRRRPRRRCGRIRGPHVWCPMRSTRHRVR